MEGNGFVIREVPVRLLNAKQYAMDYDMPELVVFLHEYPPNSVNGICIDRGDSTEDKCLLENCELDHNRIFCLFDSYIKRSIYSNVGTLEASNETEFTSQHHCVMDIVTEKYGFRNLVMEGEVELDLKDKNSIDHQPTKKTTSEALGEIFKRERDLSGSFQNWQINSSLGTIDMSAPKMGNSQCLIGSDKWCDLQEADSPGVIYRVLSTKSDQSNGSTSSSTHSFTFPM